MSASTSQATSANTGDVNTGEYFNLHTHGIGYLNRVRRVQVKGRGRKASEFLACSIAAMRGPRDDLDYTYIDCKVSGSEAQQIVESLMEDVAHERKVVIGFCIGDLYVHLYERDKRDDKGRPTGEKEPAAINKGRLLRIDFVTIDGERMYTRKPHDADGQPEDPPQQSDDNNGGVLDDELPPVNDAGSACEDDSSQAPADNRRGSRRGVRQDRGSDRSFAGSRHFAQRAERIERDEVPA